MSHDDFFDQPELDVFSSEVETLVIAVYNATIAGINSLDKQNCARLNALDRDSHPGVDWEISWWNDEVSAMRVHAGNMALVSLQSLFEHWLARNGGFQKITGSTLSKLRFNKIKTARNSIVNRPWALLHENLRRMLRFETKLNVKGVSSNK